MELFKALTALIVSAEKDAKALYEKGNKTAATRLRSTLQQIKVVVQDLRMEISNRKNSVIEDK